MNQIKFSRLFLLNLVLFVFWVDNVLADAQTINNANTAMLVPQISTSDSKSNTGSNINVSKQEQINKLISDEINRATNGSIELNKNTNNINVIQTADKKEQKLQASDSTINLKETTSAVIPDKQKNTTTKNSPVSNVESKEKAKKPIQDKEVNTASDIHDEEQVTKTISGVKTLYFVNNERVSVVLSNKDINRIAVKGDKIQAINGPSGFYSAKNDQQGAVYLNAFGEAPFTVFISTLKGYNLSLLISPNQGSGKTVVLIPVSQPELHWEETDSYHKTLIKLVSHMINNAEREEYDSRELKKVKTKDFYNIAEIKDISVYEGSYLYGVVSEIRNKTKKPITLKPSYFYEPGVRAVALLHQTLSEGATSLIYRVMSR